MKTYLVLLGLLAITLQRSYSQTWTSEIDSALTLMTREGVFEGQLLIAENQKVVFHHTYGPGSLDQALPIQSVTKVFTALAILKLVKDGDIHLEDTLTNYFPELPYPQIRLHHLLNMNSGLPGFFETALKHGDTTQSMSNEEIIALVSQQKPPAKTPGEFRYNNSNYLLLASILQKVTGMSYAEYLQKHLFTPLNMVNTHVETYSGYEPVNADNFYRPFGEGNVISTTGDLYLLDQSLTHGEFDWFSEYLHAWQRHTGANYLFGWFLKVDNELLKMRTVGDGVGSRTLWQRDNKGEQSIIYAHLNSVSYHEQVFGVLESILLDKPYRLPKKRLVYELGVETLKSYTGRYLSDTFGLLHITEENGKLYLRPDPVPDTELLVPSSETTFYFEGQAVEWEFFKDEHGKVVGFGIKGDREHMGLRQGQ